jgi:probable O-glycosylation ligase (exosortase A-associated)
MFSLLAAPIQQWAMATLGTATVAAIFVLGGIVPSIGLVLLPVAGFLAIRFSAIFIVFFILFSFFRLHEAFPVLMPFKIPKLLALASLLGIFWHLFISQKLTPRWHNALLIFVVFFVWLTLSCFLATNRALAIEYWSGTLSKIFIMVFVISWWIKDTQTIRWTRIGIMLSGCAVSIVALYNKSMGIGLVEGSRVTISRDLGSQIGDPNDLSLVLLFPVSFLCAEVFSRDRHKMIRLLALLILLSVVSGIIATQSRGGLLGIVAVVGYFFHQKIKRPMLTAAIGGFGLLVLVALAGIGDRQSGGQSESGVDESAMGRIYAWQASINMAVAHPLLGVGVDNFYSNYFYYSPHWDGKNHAVHSSWFQVLGETGFVGLFLFLLLLCTIYKILRRILICQNHSKNPEITLTAHSLRGGLLAFAVSGTFLTQAFTWPIYIILSLAIALESISNSSIEKTRGVSNDS